MTNRQIQNKNLHQPGAEFFARRPTVYHLSHVRETWEGCKNKADAVVSALRSAFNNSRQPTNEVIVWFKAQKKYLLENVLIPANLEWLKQMFAKWEKLPS